MAYAEGEALALTVLQGVEGFSPENTSRGKWGILNSGGSDHYGILKPGAFEREQVAINTNGSNYQTIIQVWQRYRDDGDTLISLEKYVAEILEVFDQERKLADTTGTIIDSFINAGREVTERWNKDGGLVWLSQDLILDWIEHDSVTYTE